MVVTVDGQHGMCGISLPPLGMPSATPICHEARPPSGSSTSSTVFASGPQDHWIYQNAGNRTKVPRPAHTKLPAIRQAQRGVLQRRHGSMNDVRSRYSAKYRRGSDLGSRLTASSPFLQKSAPEDCLKCMLKVPHRKCQAHKYIRVGGGYRHSYWFVKCLLEELELQRQQELIRQQRLEAIKETKVRAIRTYIRTKSGRLIERILYLDAEDYEAFKSGKNQKDILSKYLSKDEVKQLESWDKDEVKAIKTYVRTKSGRLIEKLVYVTKDEYQAMKEGKVNANDLLKKYIRPEDGETVEGWGEVEMKTIKTYVRTKSGRLVEKTILVSKEDYDALTKGGKDPAEVLKKYMAIGDGDQIESWQSAEPMKSIKMKIRTKSGRIIEKTVMVSKEDYEALTKGGGNADAILAKYMSSGDNIESWKKAAANPMKVIKTFVRTKSGRLVEKTVLLTEEEYRAFQESGGDPEFLKKFIKLGKGEAIEDWEKASTVYEGSDDDDEQFKKAKAGSKIIGKDGAVYEVVVDPLTGKKYKKYIGQESVIGVDGKQKGRKKGQGKGGSLVETPSERQRRKQGKRNDESDSEYSYRSVVSVGGTKHVRRRRKKADGTYSDSESYHSDQDADGAARRRRRRRARKHGSDSEHSYYSVVSAGGTRKTKRRRKRKDGTYSDSESCHSSNSGDEDGGRFNKGKKKKKRREHGSDSEYSYNSEISEGGTKRRTRRKRIRDEHGRVVGHGNVEAYSSPDDSDSESVYTTKSDGKGGKIRVKKDKRGKGGGKGKLGKSRVNGDNSPDVFSDATTDSNAVDLENMTEEERKRYLSARDKRRAEREKRRREKYGDQYEEMMDKHIKKQREKKDKAKKLKEEEDRKKAAKSMVNYDKMQGRDNYGGDKMDGREPGLQPDQWGKKKKGRDGHEADDESDEVNGDRLEENEELYQYERDPKTGKLFKKTLGSKKSRNGDARGLPEALTAEQLEGYKKGKRHSGSDSEYSYISVVSAGGTKHVQRRRKRGDGTYSATESYHSSQDEDGDVRRKQRRHNRLRENSAQSIFSERGTRHVKRRGSRKHSASEDCYSKDEDVVSNTAKMNFLATDKGYSFSSNAKGNVTSEDGDSEYSFYSERSEGGTRYEFKRKVLRDPRGIKIGYGASKPADTDTASLRPRIGSFTGESVDGDECSRRRLKTITHQSSMVEQFLLDVTTVEQDEPEEPSWPGSTETTFSGSEADMSHIITEERGKYAKEEDPTKKGKSKVDNSDERRQKREQEKLERLERQRLKEEEERRRRETLLAGRRKSMMSERAGTPREKPRSMVTYERGMGREATNPSLKTDAREIGLSHDDWRSSGRRKSYIGKHTLDKPEDPRRVSSRREIRDIPSFNKLPAININKTSSEERRVSVNKGTQKTQDLSDGENQPEHLPERKEENNDEIFEYGDDGNVRLKQGMKSIDIGSLTADDLRKMGIDPNLSPAEIARKLKEKFGNQLSITSNGRQLGTKRMEDYEKFKSITELANDPDFDVSSVRGPKRMNILFTRGGHLLLEHMKRVLVESKLRRLDFKSNLDEQNSCVDFLNHYRLVDPGKLEGYAKAFVVEDGNLDAVINYKELRIALEGIVCIENMSEKQIEYVLKVLHIDDSSQLTFRMFALITALCERVTAMEPFARHLLDICNLADIDRKLELYNAMFYHNVQSDRDPNYITSESLKIELIAGGLNWSQQQYVMRQMEPNSWGDISFLDYICYIPLFMSMHDNICDNPLDMSDRKYTLPPRKRPPSVQRDMNPLGNPLRQNSTFLLRKQALDLMSGKLDTAVLKAEKVELLNRYAKRTAVGLPYTREETTTAEHFEQNADLIV